MFRVYLDGILQDENDIININDLAEFTIIREDGFNSTEQILREKTEMQLSFGGNAYCYIHDKIKNEQCAQIDFLIEDDCGLSYNGIIPVTSSELNIFEQYGKVSIKDNSFSAYIRDYMSVQLLLLLNNTKGCYPLNPIKKIFTFNKIHNTNVSTDNAVINGFDVLDVLKTLVWYFTDNSINVVSNYLTSNRYAITTGYNMHNFAFYREQAYPEISIQDLFNELRKKLRLYMAIEYYSSGQPYLRIENEDYFFSNTTPLFNLDIQPKTVQKYDTNRDFNSIDIGSDIYYPEDLNNEYYNESRINGWIKSVFSSCGTCTGDKLNKLDLVSNYVISSNIIYEALNAGIADYTNDKSIFLFNYEIIGNDNIVKRELISGEYVYNTSLINSEVLQNWIDYYGQCIAKSRYPKNGFLIEKRELAFGDTAMGWSQSLEFPTVVYDDYIVTDYYTGTPNYALPSNIFVPVATTTNTFPFNYFEAPETNTYNLKAQVAKLYRTTAFTPPYIDVQLQIVIFTDNTFQTYINVFDTIVNTVTPDSLGNPISISLETGDITMNAGECAMVLLNLSRPLGGAPVLNYQADLCTFEMLTSGGCESIDYNNQNSKPYEVELQYPLCYEDFELARQNKNGYITMANNRYWIKEINYKPKRLSTLKLIGNNSL